MARSTVWLLPALLAVAQLVLWPGFADDPDPVRVAAVVAIVLVVAVALGFRRRAPVAVVAVVAAGLALGAWVLPGQQFMAPGDGLLVISLADLVALFAVAVRRSRRTAGVVLVALVLGQAVVLTATTGFDADYPWEVGTAAGLYLLVAAAGRIRGRTLAERAAAARRLAEAERARREAAEAERRRLARELHDVTAHHLTSIVVQASAAQFLGSQRPELRTEALEFAARTGRETVSALHRLVAVLPDGSATLSEEPAPSLADLADDFRHLGQVVDLEVSGDPPAAVAAVAHGIAREALTNTLRYAPGGTVRVRLRYGPDGAELLVSDDGPAAGGGSAAAGGPSAGGPSAAGGISVAGGLGGGRGVVGMRERAAALGGTLTAGPRGDGPGWQVRAALPPAGPGRRLRRWLGSHLVMDTGLVLLTLVLPLGGFAVLIEEYDPAPAAATLVLLALVVHAVPLLGRRRHPWAVLAAVLLTGWLGPLLAATGVTPHDGGWLFLSGFVPALVAVGTVAARAPLGWLAALLAVVSETLALSALAVLETPPAGSPPDAVMRMLLTGFLAVFIGAAFAVPFAGAWLAGHATRRRRQRRLAREEGALAAATAEASFRAREERARVAHGLRAAVLAHAARVPAAAEDDDLSAVVDSAREALAAMRGLLDGLEVPRSSSG